jgi:crotonobetainyl-CoA:carnitine CoA-transferase CaiB-like acyl-CoA transferase
MSVAANDPRVADLLDEVGVSSTDRQAVSDQVIGSDPVHDTAFRVGESAAVALTAGAVVAGALWSDRGGEGQTVTADVPRVGASLLDFLYTQVTDREGPSLAERNVPMIGLYRCRDGRWVHLHGAFPHLAGGTARVLGCAADADREQLARAVADFDGQDLEDRLADAGMCGAMVRTADEWAAHPQGRAVGGLARVEIEKLADSAPEPIGGGTGDRPLGGVRVLDLTRILAGPTHGSLLASHGADVLLLNAPRMPNRDAFLLSTSAGKLSAHLDLDQPDGPDALRALVRDADVFAQGYRSGALDRRGFGPEELAARRPGLVYVTINCYGDTGPWRERPGWEQLAQSVAGLAAEQGGIETPALIPAAACDYTTGFLAALGTMAALLRRSREGGSYHVRASLCQSAMWFAREPRVDRATVPPARPADDWFEERATPWGQVRRLRPPVDMTATPPRWDRPSSPPGTDPPRWPRA